MYCPEIIQTVFLENILFVQDDNSSIGNPPFIVVLTVKKWKDFT